MLLSQLSVFCENKPGHLLEIINALERADIEILAGSIADTKDFGVFRLIADDPEKAKEVLGKEGNLVSVSEVVCAVVPTEPNGLSGIVRVLSENRINIENMYSFLSSESDFPYMVFQVDDCQRAADSLTSAGVSLISGEDLA